MATKITETYTARQYSYHTATGRSELDATRAGLNLRDAKKAAKFWQITRDSDGSRMVLTADKRQLVALSAEQLDRVLGAQMAQAERLVAGLPAKNTREEDALLREDMGDYSHCYS